VVSESRRQATLEARIQRARTAQLNHVETTSFRNFKRGRKYLSLLQVNGCGTAQHAKNPALFS
jgi:hypothetical protein